MSEPELLDRALLDNFPLPHPSDDADKKQRGLALLIAGSRELTGAALLAGLGTLRAGAGRVRIATSQSIALGLGAALPEARVIAFSEGEDGCIDPAAIDRLVERCHGVDALVVGPGMQHGDALGTLIEALLDRSGGFPLVIDAAALGVLAPLAGKLRSWKGGLILLPHTGEMARLLQWDKEAVTADPRAAVAQAAQQFAAAAVIKGAPSLIATPDGRMFRYPGGGVGLATSGSGDVLAGIVGGLAARGADPLAALLWGVWLHGEAGRLLSGRVGKLGFLAREILDQVPGLLER
jgi:hydroxyethylthiazole kinase-like uncharacterized protein yjeF